MQAGESAPQYIPGVGNLPELVHHDNITGPGPTNSSLEIVTPFALEQSQEVMYGFPHLCATHSVVDKECLVFAVLCRPV